MFSNDTVRFKVDTHDTRLPGVHAATIRLPTCSLAVLALLISCRADIRPRLSAAERQAISEDLVERAERDQYYRGFDYTTVLDTTRRRMMQEASAVDSANLEYMRQLVDRIGWPGGEMFGADAARAAFLLVQHADRDPEFQARMLPYLTAAVERGEASASNLAYLLDRVRVKQGRPQVYGTQYDLVKDSAGNVLPGPNGRPQYVAPVVESPEELDDRRASVGLKPWAEYEQEMAELQGRAAVQRPQADTLTDGS